ncbi:thioredoxin domain-containing protein [Cryobacterium sp. BB736]|uniref:thioredoxin domain-containing protein n=1 Tax=Cryobacterium sp. BB736 TaxID=2746963 RepID=UPI0018751677|nr:thioredoxin domain-containing protein [Cryobacterium sp. BB736]
MANSLANAISPYLRSHAENPVAWKQWGEDAFAEASERDVPVLISIGYATCHWCHVMARESFSDPDLAAYLNDNFVAIKVDREEHPDVDSTMLAAASAFTPNLGWPLNVFVTPQGHAFYAGTYWPPGPVQGSPAFRQVLEAVREAWANEREQVEHSAQAVVDAIAALGSPEVAGLPTTPELEALAERFADAEDVEFGGFGLAPKFPMAPALTFLLEGTTAGRELAIRTLDTMAASGLRDSVEGGFFRYATKRDWTDPHYERMLYDNAQLLRLYAQVPGGSEAAAGGIADFLLDVLRLSDGVFASAQDSESEVDGTRTEGGYYRLSADERAGQPAPALDEKVLTGWNGMAIEALTFAGFHLDRPDWVDAARTAADWLRKHHVRADGSLVRASVDGRLSDAVATLEDYGLFAGGLLQLSLATGEADYAIAARELIDRCLQDGSFRASADPVLEARGLTLSADPSEGAYPSGVSAIARAALLLYQLTADRRYRDASEAAVRQVASLALRQPTAFGTSLTVMAALAEPGAQVVVVSDDTSELGNLVRSMPMPRGVVTVLTSEQALRFAEHGFTLFEAKTAQDAATGYLCREFVCQLPVTDPALMATQLGA